MVMNRSRFGFRFSCWNIKWMTDWQTYNWLQLFNGIASYLIHADRLSCRNHINGLHHFSTTYSIHILETANKINTIWLNNWTTFDMIAVFIFMINNKWNVCKPMKRTNANQIKSIHFVVTIYQLGRRISSFRTFFFEFSHQN